MRARTSFPIAALLALAASATPLLAGPEALPPGATEVRVERVKPAREKLATVRFLRENRDFLRQRFDLLREVPVAGRGGAADLDPRFLAYRRLVDEARASADSARAAEDSAGRAALLASITELGTLESHLDLIERQLAAQRVRLGVLEADFTGRQETALMVVLSGGGATAAPESVRVTLDDGAPRTVALSDAQRASLAQGGVVELFHGFVEPREQVVAVNVGGGAWSASSPGYLLLEPVRDRLTFLRLDLGADVAAGAAGLAASTWTFDSGFASDR